MSPSINPCKGVSSTDARAVSALPNQMQETTFSASDRLYRERGCLSLIVFDFLIRSRLCLVSRAV
eukprot:945876-Rhodomonas_salina.1